MTAPYYADESVTIYHGDCRDVLPTLFGVDLVVTDPPYLVAYDGRFGSDWGEIENDRDPRWVEPVFRAVWGAMRKDSLCVSFYGWPQVDAFMAAWKATGFRPVSHLVWTKNVWGLGFFTRGQHEQAYLLAKGKPRHPEEPISDVLPWRREPTPVHPNQKPLGAIAPLLLAFSQPGELVLDPFMGSGTTLRAAKDTGRRAVGIEVEERYCEAAALRCSQEVLGLSA